MTLFPVISRELRVEARHGFTYWLRVLGAASVAVVFFVLVAAEQGNANLGAKLFTSLHTTILIAIWILVPPMTADCIARERREGTLGLLFLTPLSARQIVLGKAFVHIARAFTLCVAAFPMLAIPVLLGGVEWLDVYTAAAIQGCSLLLALSAGVLASAFTKRFGRALLLSELMAATFAAMFGIVLVAVFLPHLLLAGPSWMSWEDIFQPFVWVLGPLVLSTGLLESSWSNLVRTTWGMSNNDWYAYLGEIVVIAAVFTWITLLIAINRVRNRWQELPASPRQLWMVKTFCTPTFWRGLFRRKMSRALDRNPISWLQQHSWSARLVKWGWCFAAIVTNTFLVSINVGGYYSWPYDFLEAQLTVATIVLAGMCFSLAGSFRSERQSGALELLLVTPLQEKQLVHGRVRGVMAQFLPVALVLVVSWCAAARDFRRDYFPAGSFLLFGFVSSFVTVPFVGLYLSLRLQNYFVALLGTFCLAILGPFLIGGLVLWLFDLSQLGMPSEEGGITLLLSVMVVLQLGIGMAASRRLMGMLKTRAFALAPGNT